MKKDIVYFPISNNDNELGIKLDVELSDSKGNGGFVNINNNSKK